jgi:SAM-dependent methyltransferase
MSELNRCEEAEWFQYWFNSPFYHLLYNNRDNREAELFIKNLSNFLNLSPGARLWDLACGKGRHSLQMSKLGYQVTGTDLSPSSIKEALASELNNLDFFVHDMRTPFRINYFDAVFNLFTSIGYFKDIRENYMVFEHVHKALRPGGFFVIDFLNASLVEKNLAAETIIHRNTCDFKINKTIKDKRVIKRIEFENNQKRYYFEEVVSLFEQDDFDDFASRHNFEKVAVFGDYDLNAYQKDSERLIMIYKK